MRTVMIVGGLLLFAYAVYEMKWAPVPSAPKRLLFNRTFTLCVLIGACPHAFRLRTALTLDAQTLSTSVRATCTS